MPAEIRILQYNELNPGKLRAAFDRTVEALRAGNFRAADVRKMGGTPFYRAKLSDADRLLFRFGDWRGERCLLLLEIVWNHDYRKARFLQGAIEDESRLSLVPDPAAAERKDDERLLYVHPSQSHFHVLDKILSLDDRQQEALSLRLPLILIGSAGSGKTVLTLERMKQMAGDVLYVTLSPHLAENSRRIYFSQGYDNEGQDVAFLSYREFIETLGVPTGRAMDFPAFAGWFSRQEVPQPLRNAHQVFEEFNGVLTGAISDASWLSEEDYVALGVRQSIFLGPERVALYGLFRKYLAMLRETGRYDLNLISRDYLQRVRPTYDAIVMDEAQDFTPRQLDLALRSLRDPAQFLLCGDSNQIVHPTFFSWAQVKTFFYERRTGGSAEIIRVLHANYRNAEPVTKLANRLIRVKVARFGSTDKESNYLARCVSDREGALELLRDTEEVRREVDERTRRSARYAVIVLRPGDVAAARRAFSTPLVFSIQEAKGLEYENVILLNLISVARREFSEIVEGVPDEALAEDAPLGYARAKDKTDKSLEAYKFYINALYVAVTRAVARVYWIEQDAQHELLRRIGLAAVTEDVRIRREESSQEEWTREARRLELQGKAEQAELIRRNILKAQPVPWAVLAPDALDALDRDALDPQKYNRQAKIRLYEYAVVYGDPVRISRLHQLKFTRAIQWMTDEADIRRKYTTEYEDPRRTELTKKIRAYGLEFRNPLNQTPLMIAAWLGRPDCAGWLLNQGANRSLLDNAGRMPLHIALRQAYRDRLYAQTVIGAMYALLAPDALKVKVEERLWKIDPHRIEFFLLHSMIAQFQFVLREKLERPPAFETSDFVFALRDFPERVIPARRTNRAYISAVLARNEVFRPNPYNRRLFLRVMHGFYLPNPDMEIEVEGEWVGMYKLLQFDSLAKTAGDQRVSFVKRALDLWRTHRQGLAELSAPVACPPYSAHRNGPTRAHENGPGEIGLDSPDSGSVAACGGRSEKARN